MLNSAFDLGEHINLRKVTYTVSSLVWKKYVVPGIDISFSRWASIKYLNESGDDYHDDILKVPNDKGGIYLFYAKCPIIPGITEYPFYIGRAKLTEKQNLRKRVKEYYSQYKREVDRPKIKFMFKYWAEELHLAFLPLNENEQIVDLEKTLINSLLLPMNDQIPDKEIRDAIKAFPK